MLNNLGLALGTNLKFYTIVEKALQLKVKTFLELNPTFVEVTGEELVEGGGGGVLFGPPILNKVKKLLFCRAGNLFFKKNLFKMKFIFWRIRKHCFFSRFWTFKRKTLLRLTELLAYYRNSVNYLSWDSLIHVFINTHLHYHCFIFNETC